MYTGFWARQESVRLRGREVGVKHHGSRHSALAHRVPRTAANPPYRAREGAGAEGVTSIVAWRALKMQEYRYRLLVGLVRFWAVFGVRQSAPPLPAPAGDYDHALHMDDPLAPSLLAPYLAAPVAPKPATRY